MVLLRRGLIPWLAGIDPDTKAPRRRVARLSEIPTEARPLVDLLVEQRLLSTDVAKDTGETTIEPAHQGLMRQWGLLQGWLEEDTGLLTVLDGIKRAARDWAANAKAASWVAHGADRLRAAERLLARPDLAANLEPTDREYVLVCQHKERADRRRSRRGKVLIGGLAAGMVGVAGLAWHEGDASGAARWLGAVASSRGTACACGGRMGLRSRASPASLRRRCMVRIEHRNRPSPSSVW